MSPATILVVEDNPITIKMVRFALENRGYRVLGAGDMDSAERLAKTERPDLCLLDLALPDGNGCDLVPKLRALPGGERMSILACSGFVSQMEEMRMSAAGFDDVVTKPVEPSRLLRIVEAHLPDAVPSTDLFGKGKHLLVVDDDPIQLKLAAVRLSRHGFSVTTASDGEHALALAEEHAPHAIVTDVLMPRVDGFQLCRAVRRHPELSRVPVVLVTNSYVEPRDRDLARGIGAVDLVLRTPDLSEVAKVLRTALERGTGRSTPTDPSSLRALDEERTKRALRQLEKQVAINAGLAQRCASLAAEIAVLRGISAALAEGLDTEPAVDAVLAACLDAGGVSLGALFLCEPDGTLRMRTQVGDDPRLRSAALVGGHAELARILAGGKTVTYGHAAVQDGVRALDGGSALVVPLHHAGTALGVMLLVARGSELLQEDRKAFAEAVANQMALALTLARNFAGQVASERRAREGEARLRSILESIPDPVIVVDPAGRLTHANRATGPFAGWLAGSSLDELLAGAGLYLPDQRTPCPPEELPLTRALRGEQAHRAELFLRRSDSEQGSWLSITALPLRDTLGRPQGAVCSFRDVTAERRAQSQLMSSDRLASVGMLAAGVAHEINNPLAVVLTNLDLALEDIKALEVHPDPSRLAEIVEELTDARHAGARVRDIVKDVRIFSRSEEQEADVLDVRRVLDSSLRMAHNEIRHRARLVKHYAEVPDVLANESRLGQVFLNLLVNAAQAITPGRADDNEICVRTERDAAGNAVVVVADSGSGMPPEVLSRLFTPFFTTKPRELGTGLGLAICQRIVTSLRGQIHVESTVGRGTTFRVVLPPAQGAAPRSTPPPEPPPRSLRRGRVLVIDDEVAIGQAVRRTLVFEHDVTVETDARRALARIRAGERFDAILCDMMMPMMTGMEVHAELERIDPQLAERVVLFTGGTFTAEARAFVARARSRRLDKPFAPGELRRVIAALIR